MKESLIEVPLNEVNSFVKGERYIISVELTRPVKLGDNSIDWKYDLDGFELPYGWFSSGFTYRIPIQINNNQTGNELLRN